VLDELRAVPWPVAVALFVGGAAVTVVLLILIIGGDDGSAHVSGHVIRLRPQLGREAAVASRPPRREAESPPRERVSVARMVGQCIMVGLHGVEPTPALLADAHEGEIGGVVLFPEGASPTAAGAAVDALQRAALAGGNKPLLVATDQEGQIKRFAAGPPKPLSELSPDAALAEGQATGSYLREYGVNVDLAPVVDLGAEGSFMAAEQRTISADPRTVADVAAAFSLGMQQARVMPVAKHFPGLGGASTNTDEAKSVVTGDLDSSLVPYRELIADSVPAIMLSTAFYTKLDPKHGAAWSRRIVEGLLRRELGFRGLTISDDLSSAGVAASLPSVGEAATDSAEAGVDIVMIASPEDFPAAHEALMSAAEEGAISRRDLRSSYKRILAAKDGFRG
jgi:beta-N-acetylhexosaminidase